MIPGIGPLEMMIVLIVAVVLFGSKLPDVARNLGQSYNQFRAGLNELKSTMNEPIKQMNTDLMPRHEKIRHYSDVDPLPAKTEDDEVPLFTPPVSGPAEETKQS